MSEVQRITDLSKGEKCKVIAIEANSGIHMRKLAAFGILPGVEVEILQTSPTYVLQVNYTQLALDYEIASYIICKNKKDGI